MYIRENPPRTVYATPEGCGVHEHRGHCKSLLLLLWEVTCCPCSVSSSNSNFATSEANFFQVSQSHFTEEQADGKTDVLRESISELPECIIAPEDFLKVWKKLLERNKRRNFMLWIKENWTNRISQNVAKKEKLNQDLLFEEKVVEFRWSTLETVSGLLN